MPVIRNIEVSGLICASLHGHAFGALHRIIAMFNLFFLFGCFYVCLFLVPVFQVLMYTACIIYQRVGRLSM